MDAFLEKYGFQDMEFHLKKHGFTDDNFHSCDGSQLLLILKDHPKVTQFMTSYAAEKYQVESKEKECEMMVVDSSNTDGLSNVIVLELDSDENRDTNNMSIDSNDEAFTSAIKNKAIANQPTNNVVTSPVSLENKTAEKRKLPADLTFKDNELYRFLNQPDNIDGRIVLGTYLRTGKVDYVRLKDVCVKSKLKEDHPSRN